MNFIKQKGFTLVEMLLVVSILLIISTGMLISAGTIRDQISFIRSFRLTEGMLSDARNRALSGESYLDKYDYDGDGLGTDLILPYGYIVHFSEDADAIITASLYADLYSSSVIGELDTDDQFIKSANLSDDIVISVTAKDGVTADYKTIDPSDFSIIYKTPNAEFDLVGTGLQNTSLQIKIDQIDAENTIKRTKYVFLHYLYGIPEVLDNKFIDPE